MRKFILNLIFVLLVPIWGYSQTVTIVPLGNIRKDSIPIKVEHYSSASTTGAITKITSNIPTDRGRTGLTQIWNTANSDQGSLTVNFPSGYGFAVGTTTYSNATLHANAWFALGTSTYNGYNGNASNPNVPTIHFTSVNNGSTDNNMSWAGTETYYDSSLGDDVFRVRYEGSYKYNVTGINTIIDLIFPKSDWTKCYVLTRTFLADGSGIEQIGLSNGSSWLASITNSSFSSGECYQLTSSATVAAWTSQGTKYTDSTGKVVFTNSSGAQYRVTLPSMTYVADTSTRSYFSSRILQPDSVIGFDWYCLDVYSDNKIDVADIQAAYYSHNQSTSRSGLWFTQSEYNSIVNSTTNPKSTYPPYSSAVISNQNTFYIVVMTYPPKSFKKVGELK